jgi:hypothetical protein
MLRTSSLLALTFLLAACSHVPRDALNNYREAFSETRHVGERLLVEYDQARQQRIATSADAQPPELAAINTDMRLRAWAVAAAWHDAIADLATRQARGDVAASVNRLASSLQAFPADAVSQAGAATAPALGVAGVVLEQVQQLRDEAKLAEAVLAADPWMQAFHRLMREDAHDLLRLRRTTLTHRRRMHISHAVDSLAALADALDGLPHDSSPEVARLLARARDSASSNPQLAAAWRALAPQSGQRNIDTTTLLHACELLGDLESHITAVQREAQVLHATTSLVNAYTVMLDQLDAMRGQLARAVRDGKRMDEAAVDLLCRAWRVRQAIEALEDARN